MSVDINYFIRNSIQDHRSDFKSLRVAADPVANRPHFDGSGSDLLLYDPSDTGGDWNYQDGGQGDPAGVKGIKRYNAVRYVVKYSYHISDSLVMEKGDGIWRSKAY